MSKNLRAPPNTTPGSHSHPFCVFLVQWRGSSHAHTPSARCSFLTILAAALTIGGGFIKEPEGFTKPLRPVAMLTPRAMKYS